MPLTAPRASRRGAAALLAAAALAATCGGRSELDVPPPLPPQPECDFDEDCPGFDNLCRPTFCVDPEDHLDQLPQLPTGVPLPPRVCAVIDPVDCDDADPCTAEECNPETGLCSYGPSTLDLDGDGFRAPLPGTVAGEEGSCGADCNDASDAAFPGNAEICDGVDNDCNGVVDDGATFVPQNQSPVRLSSDPVAPAGPGGLAFDGDNYMAIYTGTSSGFDMYQTRLETDGTLTDPIEEKFTFQNADSSGGPIIWIGDRYGVAWQDRRDNDYEAYFTILKADGTKAYPDTRLSFAPDFSVNVDLAWNGSEFIVSWQDRRSGSFQIMAQRVSTEAVPIGGNVPLTDPGGQDHENPALASGTATVAVAYASGGPGAKAIRFRSFEQTTLTPVSGPVSITTGAENSVYPTIAWSGDRYVVAWYETLQPPRAIFAATVAEDGTILTPRTPISQPPSNHFSRHVSLLPLGDRLLAIYADTRDNNDGYELYSRMVDIDLLPLGPETRITTAPDNSVSPVATFGPDGDVGILFGDERLAGADHVWFTRLSCVTQ